ncbi:MAG: phosphate acyltransferase [Bacteroidales bacterium]|nr:phosphate acyltransferase [Bacteroidales bacterium]MBN2821230.1 phosphate acyltransferase [Bacteroidales bacterium]
MRIGVDILGGDYAPEATIQGAILAYYDLKDKATLVLFGDQAKIEEVCAEQNFDPSVFEIIHTTESIGMDEYPAKAFKEKPNASIVLGFKYLQAGKIEGFGSAGNTGAMLVGAMHIVKSIPGIIRPCIAAPIPKDSDKPTLVLDAGINPDCKPDVLYQYGILGSLYAEWVYNIENPRVALFNIGSEEEKGNLQTKAAFQAMKGTKDFNFVGNVEGTDLFSNDVDVIVCDGFVGNTILKEAEAFYKLIRKRNIKDPFFDKWDFTRYGGTPVLGINAPAIIAHGISNDVAIKNMILHTTDVVKSNLSEKIKQAFE